MKKIALGLSACFAVAVITMGQVPVSVTPGSANQVYAIAGAAATPSISFAAEPGLGLYRSGAGQLTVGNTNVSGGIPFTFGTNGMQLGNAMLFSWSSTTAATGSADTSLSRVAAGEFGWTAVLFANLGTPASGTFTYCSDCTIANPCAGGGTGALAKRLNGVWVCS
jgi:hypothetical protein